MGSHRDGGQRQKQRWESLGDSPERDRDSPESPGRAPLLVSHSNNNGGNPVFILLLKSLRGIIWSNFIIQSPDCDRCWLGIGLLCVPALPRKGRSVPHQRLPQQSLGVRPHGMTNSNTHGTAGEEGSDGGRPRTPAVATRAHRGDAVGKAPHAGPETCSCSPSEALKGFVCELPTVSEDVRNAVRTQGQQGCP